ncbi:MAG: AraC family transcriptional regulator, partial [Deltaproteobacteria bacterium]|nr:AraC family transcriptional regulator [Deltaproteobacteria bacterium]
TALAAGRIVDTVHALRSELERPESLRAAAPELIRAIGGAAPARLDPRIEAALARLRAEGERVPLAELARAAGLSAGHFSDLFAREVGIPLRRWQVWARVVRAMVSTAPTLVERAADGGFADQAHMARSFRRFLGHPATALLRRPRAIDDQARSSASPAWRDTTGA